MVDALELNVQQAAVPSDVLSLGFSGLQLGRQVVIPHSC